MILLATFGGNRKITIKSLEAFLLGRTGLGPLGPYNEIGRVRLLDPLLHPNDQGKKGWDVLRDNMQET